MPFTDDPVGSYCYDAMLWAEGNGITVGAGDTALDLNMICSRAQIVTFLWRLEKFPAPATPMRYGGPSRRTSHSPDTDCTGARIVTLSEEDTVLTLSTCCMKYDEANTGSQRLVVMAKLLPERASAQEFGVSLVEKPEMP